ncbi:MAG: hypothetical protein EOO48_01880 [Flavobacterium sp.]|nr:MAG: hypothetical protein EOO48_01880 [Flavobacterium sp.]
MKKFFAVLLLATGMLCFSQTPKEKILTAVSNYFNLDRESIYAHFNKTIFFSNESIWFKGYVFNKKNNTPFFETTNVYGVLYDDDGNKLKEQLCFSYNGTFSGDFKLDKSYKSGRYHIRFYTNWMNNFKENESSTYTIDIINEQTAELADYNAPALSRINIEFQPEGGSFVAGVVNNLGIKVSDCNGHPVAVADGTIVNDKGEVVKNFLLNKAGYGKLYFTPTGETFKAVFTVNNTKVEALMPRPVNQGIALEVNNFALPGKTIIRIKTNASTVNSIPGKAVFAVIQQNDKANVFDINFNDGLLEKELAIGSDNLFPGANTIRIVDKNLNQLAERLVFEFPNYKSDIDLHVMKTVHDTITFSGKIAYPNANISVSVMPENTAADTKSDIFGLFLNPYLREDVQNTEYYLNNVTKGKRYELDLFLLNQPLKYDWRDIISAPPKMTYDFDIGLTIKGNITSTLPDPKKYRIQAFSPLLFLNDYSAINDKKEFEFKNLVVADSVTINMTLMKIPSIAVNAGFFQKVINRSRSFNKPIDILKPFCPAPIKKISVDELPQFAANTIMLTEVELKGKSKSDLAYRNRFGNASLRGYKVTPSDYNTSLLDYIGANGFNVSRYLGDVTITGRLQTTVNGARSTPEVYINGRKLMTFDELEELKMDQIDEIYLNPHAIVASMNNNMGIIKIYLKKLDYSGPRDEIKKFTIPEGFAKINSFENPPIVSTSGKGFESYGIIQWIPSIVVSETGNFTFRIPKSDVKSVRIHVQGFAADGKLLSETIVLPVP